MFGYECKQSNSIWRHFSDHWDLVGTDLIWKRHLRTVMQGPQGCHWLVKIHVKEVCGQLQRYGNEREQAICQATYGIHVSLHGSLVPRQKPLQDSLLLHTVEIHDAGSVMLARHTYSLLACPLATRAIAKCIAS